MPSFIQLTKILSDSLVRDVYRDTDEPGENQEQHVIKTTPITVRVDAIRSFYPRRENRPGTRLQFTDGGGHAVTESYDEVSRAIQATRFE